MKLSGHTRPFAVLGHPIGHTLSPIMHNMSIRALGMDAIYLAFDVAPEELMEVLPSMRKMGFGGVNLTVPLKEVAFRGIRDLDQSARHLGAVNTVEFLDDGSMRGHNTDGAGFITAIKESFDAAIRGLTVFVLGTGGAGRAVAITCAAEGAASVVLSDIDLDRCQRVSDEIRAISPALSIEIVSPESDDIGKLCRDSDLIVQSTPVGMKTDDLSLLPQDAFRQGQMVFDLVYMYPETDFMRVARASGAKCANGLGMLLHQGARAFHIWTGMEPAIDVMRSALESEVYGP